LIKQVTPELSLPDRVEFNNTGLGPSYSHQVVEMRFPFFGNFDPPLNRITKSAQESLPITLHELGHAFFEQTLTTLFEGSPEVIWAFTTREDMLEGPASLEYIDRTKGNTRFSSLSSVKIQKKFSDLKTLGDAYNELFADAVVVFGSGNPKAIYESIHFPKVELEGQDYEKAFEISNRCRIYDVDHKLVDAESGLKEGDFYVILAPSRRFLWEKVYQKFYSSSSPQMPLGQMLQRILRASVASIAEVTQGYELATRQVSAADLNKSFIGKVKLEFGI
jgi:hypothetical protein